MAKSKNRVETICNVIGNICLLITVACMLAIPITYELWLAGYID